MAAKAKKSQGRASGKRGGKREVDLSILGEHPSIDVYQVLRYFRTYSSQVVTDAMDDYFTAVGADPEKAANEAHEQALYGSFVDWFVFERRLSTGQTPLEHYALVAPHKTDEEKAVAELMRQMASSQLFSLFWVRQASKQEGTLTFRDVVNDAAFAVWDPFLAEDIADIVAENEEITANIDGERVGTLVATHLVEVAGEWRIPVDALLVRPQMLETGFVEHISQLAEYGGSVTFLDAARLELGNPETVAKFEGPLTKASQAAGGSPAGVENAPGAGTPADVSVEGAQVEAAVECAAAEGAAPNFAVAPAVEAAYAAGTPANQAAQPAAASCAACTSESADAAAQAAPARVVLDGPASEVPGIELPPERRLTALAEAARLYGLLERDFELPATWDDVVSAVREKSADYEPSTLMGELFKASEHGLDHLDDAAFEDLAYCFIMAWNLLPHKELGGQSPAEAYTGR